MEIKEISRTMLSVYRYLEAITRAIDNQVKKQSINSAFYSSHNAVTTYEIANKVLELSERKVKLINLKVVIEEGLESLSETSRRLLLLNFLDQLPAKKIAETMNISLRTYFRRKEEAINTFAKNLLLKGYSLNFLISQFFSQEWLKKFYIVNAEKQQDNNSLSNKTTIRRELVNAVLFNLSYIDRKFSYK